MPDITLPDGSNLHFQTTGNGPGLILIAGLTGLGDFWDAHVRWLAGAYTVVTYDHRGCGASSLEEIDFSIRQMADDVLALMDALDMERADLIGHSTGGAIGQLLAIENADRLGRLVISASWAGFDPYFDLLFDVRARILTTFGPAEYLRQSALFKSTPDWLSSHPEDCALPSPEITARLVASPTCTLKRIDAIRAHDVRDRLGRITAPTLVCGARLDLVTPIHLSEEIARLIPGAEITIAENCGHFYPVTHPDIFKKQIGPFLGLADT